MSALIAGGAPPKGTNAGFASIIELNSRPHVYPTEPIPACAMFSFLALAFTYRANSWRLLAGTSFLATIIWVPNWTNRSVQSQHLVYRLGLGRMRPLRHAFPCAPFRSCIHWDRLASP